MKRTLKPLDIREGELDTRFDANGVEFWVETGKRVSTNNAFRSEGTFDTRKMSANAACSRAGTFRITNLSAEGVNIGTIPGLSKKTGGTLKPKDFNIFQTAKGNNVPNWSTLNKKAKAS